MKYFTMSAWAELIKDFDLVAKKNNRNRTYHLRQLMLDAVNLEHKNNPETFNESKRNPGEFKEEDK